VKAPIPPEGGDRSEADIIKMMIKVAAVIVLLFIGLLFVLSLIGGH
jgi:hypothetical protein